MSPLVPVSVLLDFPKLTPLDLKKTERSFHRTGDESAECRGQIVQPGRIHFPPGFWCS